MNADLENDITVYALGKSIAFFLYSVLAIVLLLPVIFLTPITQLPDLQQALIVGSILVSLELLILFSVIRGILPGANPNHIQGFNEKKVAGSIVLISAFGSLFLRGSFERDLFRYFLVGSILFIGVVYFIVKSLLSRSIRWGVILVFLPSLLELTIPHLFLKHQA